MVRAAVCVSSGDTSFVDLSLNAANVSGRVSRQKATSTVSPNATDSAMTLGVILMLASMALDSFNFVEAF